MTQPDPQPHPSQEPLLELRAVMARLRAECPWKAKQTHASLLRYLLEEAHEVVEAVEAAEPSGAGETGEAADEHLAEELGDLLLQVYFHAAIAAQDGRFDIDDVARGIVAKLHRRNPHVFGPDTQQAAGLDARAVDDAWQAIKAAEKQRTGVVDGIAPTLPALLRAEKVLDRLERAGRPVGAGDLPDPGDEDAELGQRLLALVVRARQHGTDPEQALRTAVRDLPGVG